MADIYYGIEFGGHKATVLRSTSPLPSSDVEVRLTYDANLNSKLKALQAMARLCGKIVESDFPPAVEQTGPVPLLLDTFTAADGTDPTSRDLDVYPAGIGTNRWRWEGEEETDVYESDLVTPTGEKYYYMLPGKVQSNALTPTQTVTLTTGMFAPSTTLPQNVSLKLRTDSAGALFNTDNLFLFIEGNEGTSTLTPAELSGIRIIDLIVRDAPYDNYMQLEVQIGGYLRALFSDAGSYQSVDAEVTGQKKFGLYVSSSQLALVVNGNVAASVSTGLVAAVPWSNVELMMRNPVVSSYVTEYRDAKLDKFAIYQGLTLSQALALTA